ncbi:DUF1819 family protein [Verrucomicrobia bacterium]|nr:DUF1819 family protein [Verrucomicrobiota bacterium]
MAAAEQLNFSQRLVRKGALATETYQVLQHWDHSKSIRENIDLIREANPVGAPNEAWLREVAATLSSRFSHGDDLYPLSALAKAYYPPESWTYCLLWHFGSTDGLYLNFACNFLFPQLQEGVSVITTEEVMPFVSAQHREGFIETELSDYGTRRTARDLLRMAAAFRLVEGQPRRQFSHPLIPEDAILYAVYSLMDQVPSVNRMIASERWRLFLMCSEDVERELMNLHQFHRLRYEAAGTVRELDLPFANLTEFVQSLIA